MLAGDGRPSYDKLAALVVEQTRAITELRVRVTEHQLLPDLRFSQREDVLARRVNDPSLKLAKRRRVGDDPFDDRVPAVNSSVWPWERGRWATVHRIRPLWSLRVGLMSLLAER